MGPVPALRRSRSRRGSDSVYAKQRNGGEGIVITGASGGIGEATTRMLARHGARLVVGARRTERLATLVADLRATGSTAEYQAVDVTQREQVSALVNLARRTYGRLDVMINNAGIMPLSPLEQLKVDEWERMIDFAMWEHPEPFTAELRTAFKSLR